jgi:predicted amidophosphoribosyltransferase
LLLDENTDSCPRCGSSFCPDCGALLDENAAVCSACGAEFAIFCSACEREVDEEDLVCPHCGADLVETAPDAVSAGPPGLSFVLPPRYTGQCPSCDSPLFLEDGFCNQCGALFCTRCSGLVSEEDDHCPHCHTALFFNCPLCGFELTSGTDQCPNCNALIPNFCVQCGTALALESDLCPKCGTAVQIIVRQSARIIHSLKVGEEIVQVAACPGCGGRLHVHEGRCQSCGYRICITCQISLQPEEKICPRCGPDRAQIVLVPEHKRHCPTCGQPLPPLADECPQCGQLFCPECLTAVAADALSCRNCGIVFDFECPECGEAVSAETAICPRCGALFEE